ncbi:hypothetical protein RQP54_05385 [Curvibacter sp. APW13]|uniref:hypothetical protein n=1 Tax=Curvibacter sp. APW13 TaxID=3077236 RepID=UPI0028DD58C7|nr:hypothetical protein [Curvibacter sp. APW13]MDT8990293.1 hypothetical protein [Curvibacter sp. APW13]
MTSTPLRALFLLIALDASLSGCSPSPLVSADPASFSLAIIGDVPYGKSPTDTRQLEAHPRFLAALDQAPEVSLVAHIGDTHAGKQYCTEAYNRTILGHWQALRKPLVYTPGDNEWMDCHKVKEGGGSYNKATGQIDYVVDSQGQPVDYARGNPVANLDLVRSLFFARPGQTLGQPMAVHSQAQEFNPAYPADKAFVENVWWERGGVLFVTLNIPGGSNNGTDPWYGTPSMGAAQKNEVATRTAATLRWIETAFNRASTAGDVGVVILTQADLWNVDEADSGVAHVSGYRPYVDRIAEGAKAYGLPVLMVVGDSHTYRSDNPLAKGSGCVVEVESGTEAVPCSDARAVAMTNARKSPADAYEVHPVQQQVPNFHRVVVHGETLPLEWLQLRVDPSVNAPQSAQAFGPFSWKRVRPAL